MTILIGVVVLVCSIFCIMLAIVLIEKNTSLDPQAKACGSRRGFE